MSIARQIAHQFAVDIRRQSQTQLIINKRMTMSSNLNINAFISLIKTITPNNFLFLIAQLKQYSHLKEAANMLSSYLQQLCQIIWKIDILQQFYQTITKEQRQKHGKLNRESLFEDTATILINILYYMQIVLPIKDYGSLVQNLNNSCRDITTMWLCGQILHGNGKDLSRQLMQFKVVDYVEQRVSKKFLDAQSITIFAYFTTSLLMECREYQFREYKRVIKVLERLVEEGSEEIEAIILDGLVVHAEGISHHDYILLSSSLLTRCEKHCQLKKSIFVAKYLSIVIRYVQSQACIKAQELAKGTLQHTIVQEQYGRMKSSKMVRNAYYCLQNRSPQIKALVVRLGTELVSHYHSAIDLEEEDLYLELAAECGKMEKMNDALVCVFLHYVQGLAVCFAPRARVHDEAFVAFLKQTNVLSACASLLRRENPEVTTAVVHLLKQVARISKSAALSLQQEGLIDALSVIALRQTDQPHVQQIFHWCNK